MTTGKSRFRAMADLINSGGAIYLVDAAGGVHALDVTAYTALNAQQLRGSRVFTQPAEAERFAERRRATRN